MKVPESADVDRRFLLTGVAMLAAPRLALGQTPTEFFKGKAIRLIVSTTAGGGYDLRGRLMARHFGRFVPGNPQIVVENMPGGGSVVAVNYAYNVAPRDGTSICLFQRSIFTTPMLTPTGVRFELSKFNWLGSLGAENGVVVAWRDAPVKSTADMFNTELITGMPGATMIPTVFNAIIGTKFKVISGYPGNNEVIAAMERGEVQAIGEWSWPNLKTTKAAWLADGSIRLLMQIGTERNDDLKSVPLAQDFAKSEEDKRILDIFTSPRKLAYPLVLPPDVPADRVAVLREAFTAMSRDPEFLSDMQKAGMEGELTSGREVGDFVIKTFGSLPASLAQRISAFGPIQ